MPHRQSPAAMPPMSARDRHTRTLRSGRPPDLPSLASLMQLLWVALILAANHCHAQTTTTSSALAASTQSLSISSIPSLINLPSLNSSRPLLRLSFAPTSPVYLTINLCSLTSNASLIPNILVSTASSPSWDLGNRPVRDGFSGGTRDGGFNRRNTAGGDTWALTLDNGFGNWTLSTGTGLSSVSVLVGLGMGLDGKSSSVTASGNVAIQLGISNSGPLHRLSGASPLLGDTTATTALLFSNLLRPAPQVQPTYPNYTLPPAQMIFTPPDQSNTNQLAESVRNLSLILIPTGSSPTNDGLDNSLCAVRAANTSTGGIVNSRTMVLNRTDPSWSRLDDDEGYRVAWGVGDLVGGGANYTAWLLDEATSSLSRPIWLATKEASFSCPIVMSNPTCPSIAYAAPLSPNSSDPTHPLIDLSDDLKQNLTANLNAFSTSILSTACGRDLYSYTSSCLDCYTAYRDWLCRILIPRCTTNTTNSGSPDPKIVHRTRDQPRLANIPVSIPQSGYDELLPCLSTCNAVDRACPMFLSFRCPKRNHGAERSYGFIGDRVDRDDGAKDNGLPSTDKWGNAWCNG